MTSRATGGEDGAASEPARPRERSWVGVLFALAGVAWAVAGYGRSRRHAGPPSPAAAVASAEVGDEGGDGVEDAERPPSASDDAEPASSEGAPTDAEAQVAEEGSEGPSAGEGDTRAEVFDAEWARVVDPPALVTYTVRHGGSIKNVANLFKIYHHEITALNPRYSLDQELPPDTQVVVWRARDGLVSESVGDPGAGSLVGAVPMMEGPGRVLKAVPWKAWGTLATVTHLDAALREWAHRKPDGQPVLVGNLSAPQGGKLPPHSSHQSGRDVDLSYIQRVQAGEELNWREMSATNLDAAQTWELLRLLREGGEVEAIFIDSKLQKLLYEHAVAERIMPKASLARWLEYPRQPGTTGALIRHVPGHVDHIHVRFRCPADQPRCRSR